MKSVLKWYRSQYLAPSPLFVKRQVLVRNAIVNGIYVETGTYLGDTTNFLSQRFPKVISIEPEATLFEKAKKRFSDKKDVHILHGCSEDIFPTLLTELNGDINFWLDGHYSGGDFWKTYKGKSDTPIISELRHIRDNIHKFNQVAILVDDIRCFQEGSRLPDYPTLDYLVDWARELSLNWHIEHDIFVARSAGP
ncbi:hypothetical protein ASL19_15895 [Cylindrospermopsis sp. CR12]|nr:hypothetical protein ASL19_15895 [Cylindrospermopsis sp. CR12]